MIFKLTKGLAEPLTSVLVETVCPPAVASWWLDAEGNVFYASSTNPATAGLSAASPPEVNFLLNGLPILYNGYPILFNGG